MIASRKIPQEILAQYHIPTIASATLSPVDRAQNRLPEALWQMAARAQNRQSAGIHEAQYQPASDASTASTLRLGMPTQVFKPWKDNTTPGMIGIYTSPLSAAPESTSNVIELARIPVQRLQLTDTERQVMRDFGVAGVECVVRHRVYGRKVEGEPRDLKDIVESRVVLPQDANDIRARDRQAQAVQRVKDKQQARGAARLLRMR